MSDTATRQGTSAYLKSLEATFGEGEVVFKEGDTADRDLYILQEGSVEVCKGIFKLADVSEPNTFLGEMSMLLKEPRSATVVATTPCRLVRIPADQAQKFFLKAPAMWMRLATVLARRLSDMNLRYEQAMRSSAPAAEEEREPGADSAEAQQRLLRIRGLASLSVRDGAPMLTDIQEANSTFLNGTPILKDTPVANGDLIQLGEYLVQFFSEHPALVVEKEEPAAPQEPEPEPEAPPPEEEPEDHIDLEGPPSKIVLKSTEPVTDLAQLVARVDAVRDEPFPEALDALIEKRLQILSTLEEIEQARKETLRDPSLSEVIKAELRRQTKEAEQCPPIEQLRENLLKLSARLAEAQQPPEPEDEDDQPPPPPDPKLLAAWKIGIEQYQVQIARESLTPEILAVATPLAESEPLFQTFETLGIPTQALFGWAMYALAVDVWMTAAEAKADELSKQLSATPEGGTRLFRLKKSATNEETARTGLAEEERKTKSRAVLLEREKAWLQPSMVEEFWSVYEAAATALIAGRVQGDDEPFVRAFLRQGLLGCAPRFLQPELAHQILQDCAVPMRNWRDATDETMVVYADEYIELAATGQISPSFDEDLELNQQLTPLWKADRAWRRIIHSRVKDAAYLQIAREIYHDTTVIRKRQEGSETNLKHLKPDHPRFKKKQASLKASIQECKVDAARNTRVIEKVVKEMIPRIKETRTESRLRLKKLGMSLSKQAIVRQEAAGIRRVSRLVAKLAEPFLPFALRDSYRPEQGCVHSRADLMEEIKEAETLDPLLLKEPLFPSEDRKRRIYVRHSPIFLVAPARGYVGYLWNPRAGAEFGRMVVPAYAPRPRMLRDLFWALLADFRFDSSRAASGIDFIKSDTLAATYAAFRWSFKRRPKDVREKAAIFLEEKDRSNWRRHYALYMKSAMDGGVKLFHRAPELYKAMLKHFDLPEGVEPLKKS